MMEKIKRFPWEKTQLLLWGLVLLFMPVTSFKYLPSFMGTTTIRPLSFYPLILLILLLLPDMLRNWREFSGMKSLAPLLVFIMIALGVSLWNGITPPAPLNKLDYEGRVLRAFLTLAIGLMFFLAALWMSRKKENIQYGLKWLYAGLALSFVWGIIQLVAIYTPLLDRELVIRIQELYSVRGLRGKRVIGFAYEPSWLADQLLTLYLPWLIGSLFSGYRVSRYRWLEWALTAMALFLLTFTFSRSGILGFVAVLGIVTIIAGRSQLIRAWQWLWRPFREKQPVRAKLIRTVVLLGGMIILAGAGAALSSHPYFARMWTTGLEEGLDDYIMENSAGPRVAYALAAFETYNDHPWEGVGFGALGFYLYDHLPDWVMTTEYEIARHLTEGLFPNAKNMYLRLLGETGIFGFWAFTVFLFIFLGFSHKLGNIGTPFALFMGTSGLFLWLVIAFRNLSQDSFTAPVMWIGLGILQGTYYLVTKNKAS